MNPILIAAIAVSAIGAVCGVMLVLASKFFGVKEDERYGAIRECLPGANCGACGYAGCDGYAKALNEEEGTKTNLCIPGADATAKQIAEILDHTPEIINRVKTLFGGKAGTEAGEEKKD